MVSEAEGRNTGPAKSTLKVIDPLLNVELIAVISAVCQDAGKASPTGSSTTGSSYGPTRSAASSMTTPHDVPFGSVVTVTGGNVERNAGGCSSLTVITC